MEIAVSTVRASAARQTFELHHLTDLHYDDPDHAEKELAERIAHIAAAPDALWVGGGDYGSLILPDDPRFATGGGNVHRLPDQYVETITELLWPIRDKCVGFGTGNHEWAIGKRYHRGVGAEVAMKLGVPHLYLGARGWCIVTFEYTSRRVAMKIFQYHGWSAGRLRGRKALQAERDLGAWNADVLMLGHDHVEYAEIWYTEEPKGGKGGWKLHQRPRAFLNGGSWTYGQTAPHKAKGAMKASEFPNDLWSETKNFRPQPPSSPYLLVHVDFGHGKSETPDGNRLGRAAGIDLEIHQRGNRYEIASQ